ncbi:HEAT repeat domain-containing protein [Paenibacillus cremeus]|uniref:Phytanoyl-CoA dioxygenase n=1 Tax=Paenibacillus cremeus TaxID=2163881 RepID=A0A559KGF1_9BACL|nr:HEAT repeat domain-containing protein [Paenibacillus cremeus]TVY11202.1 phytanoyl-CoA dioxygenase [Paenibacillus cremeus]
MGREVPVLLTDEQMRKFITEGFLILKTDFSEAFHQQLRDQLNLVYEKEGNPGNNLLPRIRELQKVFDHPIITGALTSVLGPDYLLHTHRHGHLNAAPKPGNWHKDSYWGYKKIRNHHPWWAMIMYFPQDTPVELGPTGVMPGTQNYDTRTFEADESEYEAVASGKEGTFALIHYDIWHRSTPNMVGQMRYMLKFEFMRTQAPTAPSWDCVEREWKQPASYSANMTEHEEMWKDTWNWLSGQVGSLANTVAADETQVEAMAAQLEDAFEPNAINAAYRLAGMGEAGVQALLRGLRHENVKVSRTSAYGLSAAGAGAVAGLQAALAEERTQTVVHAAFALGELRHFAEEAVPSLLALLHPSGEAVVRQTVAEALALIGKPTDQVVAGLIRCLQDEDVQVRFVAGLSLCRMGAAAEAAVPALEAALEDDNRYVRGHAAEALHYIGTGAAKDVLIGFLLKSRWCPSTTPQSTFYP